MEARQLETVVQWIKLEMLTFKHVDLVHHDARYYKGRVDALLEVLNANDLDNVHAEFFKATCTEIDRIFNETAFRTH